jgi:hypothetical protein
VIEEKLSSDFLVGGEDINAEEWICVFSVDAMGRIRSWVAHYPPNQNPIRTKRRSPK